MADFDNMCEITIEWLRGQDIATVSAYNNSRMKGKILKLAAQYPDEVDYIENKDGSIVGHVPVKYVKISHPRIMSEEQKEASAKRLAELRQNGLSRTQQ